MAAWPAEKIPRPFPPPVAEDDVDSTIIKDVNFPLVSSVCRPVDCPCLTIVLL